MHAESVRADSWCLVNFRSFLFVDESTLDHPPTDRTLKSSKGKHADQNIAKVRLDVSSREEVHHWSKEDDADGPANDSVEPLPEEDVLESVYIHAFVLIDL